MPRPSKGPRFVAYFGPVLEALRDLGSSARPKEVCAWIAEHREVPAAELEAVTKGGQSKFEKQVHWARFYLNKAGLIDGENRSVWVLSEAGRKTTFADGEAHALFRRIHDQYRANRQTEEAPAPDPDPDPAPDAEDESAPDEQAYLNENEVRERLIEILRGLSDAGFEELCARLLRHIGFENVKVTGRSGDRGVDGEGHLTINRFVRTKVMFQCKRYTGTVGPEKIRDFRGAIQGRAERGIFLTTAAFTTGARAEAARENATPVELVDIDRLLDLLIEERLGVRETRALVIEKDFFQPYARGNDAGS